MLVMKSLWNQTFCPSPLTLHVVSVVISPPLVARVIDSLLDAIDPTNRGLQKAWTVDSLSSRMQSRRLIWADDCAITNWQSPKFDPSDEVDLVSRVPSCWANALPSRTVGGVVGGPDADCRRFLQSGHEYFVHPFVPHS